MEVRSQQDGDRLKVQVVESPCKPLELHGEKSVPEHQDCNAGVLDLERSVCGILNRDTSQGGPLEGLYTIIRGSSVLRSIKCPCWYELLKDF